MHRRDISDVLGKDDFSLNVQTLIKLLKERIKYKKLPKKIIFGGFTPFDCKISSKKFFCNALKLRLSLVSKTFKKNNKMKILEEENNIK